MYRLLYRRPNTAVVSKQNQLLLKSFDAVIRNREKLMARGFETIVYKNNKVVNFDKELTNVALNRMKAMGHIPNMASKDEINTLVQKTDNKEINTIVEEVTKELESTNVSTEKLLSNKHSSIDVTESPAEEAMDVKEHSDSLLGGMSLREIHYPTEAEAEEKVKEPIEKREEKSITIEREDNILTDNQLVETFVESVQEVRSNTQERLEYELSEEYQNCVKEALADKLETVVIDSVPDTLEAPKEPE